MTEFPHFLELPFPHIRRYSAFSADIFGIIEK